MRTRLNAMSSLSCKDEKSLAQDVRVETLRAFALDVLGGDEAREFTGRNPRMLAPFEVNVLLEDVKTTGVRPKRLKEMLKFLFRGWSELADDDPEWIITQEEQTVVDTLKGSLSLTRGILEPEISNLAVNYLRSHPDALEAASLPYVFVDDYQLHSLASQVLAGMLAKTSLYATGDPCAQSEVYESYPHIEGLAALAKHEQAQTHTLDESFRAPVAVNAVNALLNDPCYADAGKTLQCAHRDMQKEAALHACSFPAPEDELNGIAATVTQLIEEGMQPGEILVAVPNKSWLKNAAVALGMANLSADAIFLPQSLANDVRDTTRCADELAFTALALTANPNNALALRSWCAFGDYLAGSSVFEALRKKHQETEESLSELLEEVFENPTALGNDTAYNLQGILNAYAESKHIAAEATMLRGKELLDALSRMTTGNEKASASPSLLRLCAPIADDSTAEELYAHAVNRLTFPTFAHEAGSVKLGLYESATGLNPKAVVLAGFVNGFFPKRSFFEDTQYSLVQRERMHAADTKALYNIASKAMESLHATYFTEAPLEAASALNLKVERIRMKQGRRMCAIAPSIFLKTIAGE